MQYRGHAYCWSLWLSDLAKHIKSLWDAPASFENYWEMHQAAIVWKERTGSYPTFQSIESWLGKADRLEKEVEIVKFIADYYNLTVS